jgi:hypothetical protein
MGMCARAFHVAAHLLGQFESAFWKQWELSERCAGTGLRIEKSAWTCGRSLDFFFSTVRWTEAVLKLRVVSQDLPLVWTHGSKWLEGSGWSLLNTSLAIKWMADGA